MLLVLCSSSAQAITLDQLLLSDITGDRTFPAADVYPDMVAEFDSLHPQMSEPPPPDPVIVFVIHGALKEPKPLATGHRRAHMAAMATSIAGDVAQVATALLQALGRK